MDTKLIKNKILKDLVIVILVFLSIFNAILFKNTYRAYVRLNTEYNKSYLNNYTVTKNIQSLEYSILEYISIYKDIEGNKKLDIYNENVVENKKYNDEKLEEIEKQIREVWKGNNLSEEEINEKVEKAQNIVLNNDGSLDDYYTNVMERFTDEIHKNLNIEFFVKDDKGDIVTNIKDENFEEKINNGDFTEDREYYYMYYPSLEAKFIGDYYSKDLDMIYNSLSNENKNLTRFYRIPKEPLKGDYLYGEWLNRETQIGSIFKDGIKISLCLVLILALIFTLYKNKESTNIEKVYIKIPLDLRIVIFIYSFNILKSLIFNVIPYYENSSYSNGVILKSVIFIILGYYLLKDIILILNKKRDKGKILIIKLYKFIIKLIKSSEFIKTNKFKFISIILISILALFCLWLEFFIYLPYNIMLFTRGYLCLYMIMASILSIMIFREISILASKTLEVTKGNYKYDIKDNKIIVLKNIEKNISTIEDGLKEALDKAIISEKMKSELITNVSHDLKTPLTSIINYIDLLKEDEITDENRNKYLEVLDMKSKRLKVLIEDLFEASKAVSGNMVFEKEELNIVSLLRQVIGELEEKITQANLNIITKWPEDKTILYLDGRKTFRVYENLMNNIIKYSMENSRVYIDVVNSENHVMVIMKNISAYQIDFTSEEITERFKRGDKARSTEGSGLGLSIAKSIVELQGGEFSIEIDGDLFKVITKFKK